MKLQVFTAYDVQAQRCIHPFVRENANIAIRDFERMVTEGMFKENPDDYNLYHIGEWDDANMLIEGRDPQRIITGLEAYQQRLTRENKVKDLHNQIDMLKDQSYGGTD